MVRSCGLENESIEWIHSSSMNAYYDIEFSSESCTVLIWIGRKKKL